MVNLPATQDYTPHSQEGQSSAVALAFTEPAATDLETRRAEQRRKRYKRKAPKGSSQYPFCGKQRLIYDCPHTIVFVCTLDGLRVRCEKGSRLSHKTTDGTIGLLAVLSGLATQVCQQCPFYKASGRS